MFTVQKNDDGLLIVLFQSSFLAEVFKFGRTERRSDLEERFKHIFAANFTLRSWGKIVLRRLLGSKFFTYDREITRTIVCHHRTSST